MQATCTEPLYQSGQDDLIAQELARCANEEGNDDEELPSFERAVNQVMEDGVASASGLESRRAVAAERRQKKLPQAMSDEEHLERRWLEFRMCIWPPFCHETHPEVLAVLNDEG